MTEEQLKEQLKQIEQAAYDGSKKGIIEGFEKVFATYMKPGHMVTQKETARLLGVSVMTVYRMVQDGKLIINNNGRVPKSELIRILNE